MRTFRKILVPDDFSPHAREARDLAVEMARRFDAELTLLHVIAEPVIALPEGYLMTPPDVLQRMRDDIDRALAASLAEIKGRGIRATTMTAEGSPFGEIVRLARAGGFDLIVMGTHGRGGVAHVLLGSVAERVVRKAPCPVLTVRPEAH